MRRNSRTIWVEQFKGLNDSVEPGSIPTTTPDLTNVKIRHGQVVGRGGMQKYLGVTDAASSTIIGLFDYQRSGGTHQLVRMLPTSLELLNPATPAWGTIAGDALSGTATTRPQFTVIDDTLVFVNEGLNLPRKFEGSGSNVSIASGTSPYAKSVESYLGFLMLGNISDDGTFTDVFDGHRIIRYSDDWDFDWTGCAGNELTLDESPGSLIAMKVLGKELICYKTDALVRVTWIGGQIVFRQEKLREDVGCLAPLSVQKLGEHGHIFLGSDAMLYLVTQSDVRQISYAPLYDTLPPTLSLNKLHYARSVVDTEEDTYYLFYDRTGLEGQLLDSYVSYNYLTGEFAKGTLGHNLTSTSPYRAAESTPLRLLVASPTLVRTFDEGKDDDGKVVVRHTTTNWQGLAEEGIFTGARLIFKKTPKGRVKVSVAREFEQTFRYEQTFHLRGGNPNDAYVEVHYRTPNVYGSWFNLKVKFYHDGDETEVSLRRVGLEGQPLHQVKGQPDRRAENTSA